MENINKSIDILKAGLVVAIAGVAFLAYQNHTLQKRLDALDKGVIYKKAIEVKTGDYMYRDTKIAKDIQFLLKDYVKKEKKKNRSVAEFLEDTKLDTSKMSLDYIKKEND